MNDKIKTLIQIFKHLKINNFVYLISYDNPAIIFMNDLFFNQTNFITRPRKQ
jgi:hypothetical protein